jgi:hypothetical protein
LDCAFTVIRKVHQAFSLIEYPTGFVIAELQCPTSKTSMISGMGLRIPPPFIRPGSRRL